MAWRGWFRRKPDSPAPDAGSAASRAVSLAAEASGAAAPGPWRVVKNIAAIVTPLTLITALMFYFGMLHAYWFFAGFGVDYTVFELSAEDYILRSADGLLFPLGVAALAVLVIVWACQLVGPAMDDIAVRRLLRIAVPVCSLLGLGLTVLAGFAFVRPAAFVEFPAVGGLALVFGMLLLVGAIRAMRRVAGHPPDAPARSASWVIAEWTAVVALVSVGLFWAVGDWSARVGSQRAHDVVAALPAWPSVIVYSERGLNLDGAGVIETACSPADAAFSFRYDGLVLITQEGGQMMLLPRAWTAAEGTAIVLTKTDTVRLEFSLRAADHAVEC
jgi:hypothetical protein